MARSRNIKPGFFANDALAECEPLARLLFAGLWTICDREGRAEDRPKRIRAELLPYDDCDVDALLTQLATHGFLVRYAAAGGKYLQVVNFTKHQDPHYKEKASEIPAPPGHADSSKTAGGVAESVRQAVFDRDGRACKSCLSTDDLSLDHIIPRSKGGSHDECNLQTLCRRCNSAKNNREAGSIIVRSLADDQTSSGNEQGGKSPLNPDSLIPSSLIPDSLNLDSLTELPPAKPDSPSAGGGEDDFVDDQPEPDSAARFIPSDAARMMLAMKAEGISDGSASNPKFVELVKSGASPGELMDAARRAVKAGKGFNYAIGIAIRERQEAAALALTMPKGPLPAARSTAANETFAERDARIGRERWEEMTGRTHPDNIKTMPAATQFVEDITPQFLEHTR